LKKGRPKKIYAVYEGDKFVATGTVAELAEVMGVTEATIRFQISPTYQKRCKAGGIHREIFPLD
jgi:predicted transcriptional regulator